MRAYGSIRVLDREFPDKADITNLGLPPTKYLEKRKSTTKRRTRRYWKKRHRQRVALILHISPTTYERQL